MSEEQGIKETKEMIVGVYAIGKIVLELAKDGVDFSDAIALGKAIASDEALRDKITAAADRADQVPAEIKDLSFMEGVDLIQAIIEEAKA